MSSPKSPYKEVGLRASDVSKRRRAKGPRLPPCPYDRKTLPTFGHDFVPLNAASPGKRGRYVLYSSISTCRRCGQPRFAVDGLRCKGKRPQGENDAKQAG